MRVQLGLLLVALSIGILAYTSYANSRYATTTRPFSSYTLLASSWEHYKHDFISADGRVIDHAQANTITTSEGQSYALLRAVWIDDQPTFDRVLKWTQDNLKRPNDHLFSWRWGKREDGSYGTVTGGGENSASDADSDIAFALLLANQRWSDTHYREAALPIIQDLWTQSTDTAAGHRYLVAGNWAHGEHQLTINPSYFAPYAWREFARVDPDHDWSSLITPAYQLLTDAGKAHLDRSTSVGLPPDWVSIDRESGVLSATPLMDLTTNYGFDAMRIPWRVALDVSWSHDPQATNYLKSLQFLAEQYRQTGALAQTYTHDGQVVHADENPTMYATALGYFMIVNPTLGSQLYQDKVLRLYSNNSDSFDTRLPYYDQNWLWFGEALYNHHLPEIHS